MADEPIYINRACPPNCPGNIKPRTPAEAEALVDGIEEAVRHVVGHSDWGEDKEEKKWRLKLDERKAALISALTGGEE